MRHQQKRAEIVDLTGEDSDEGEDIGKDVGESMIRPRSEADPGPGQSLDFEANKANSTPASAHNLGQPSLEANTLAAPPPFTQSSQYTSLYLPLRDLPDIIKPIDWSKVKKIRKWAFDPDTIARDVLLATNSHPTRPGLNYHLRPLLSNFTHVNANSDLATFRWDLVDPGGPGVWARPVSTHLITMPMPPPSEEQSHAARNLPVRLPLKPTRGGVSSGGFGAAGRPSSTLPLTHHGLHPPDSGFFKRSFDSTPRTGGISLSGNWGPPRQQVGQIKRMQRPMMSSGLVPTRDWNTPEVPPYKPTSLAGFGLDGQFMSSPYHNSEPTQHAHPPIPQPKASVQVVMKPATPVNFPSKTAKSELNSRGLGESGSGSDAPSPSSSSSTPGRGRPPKISSFVIEVPSLTPKKRGRPFKKSEESSATDRNTKKRGRPFKSAESAVKGAAAGSDSADGIPKKRGRPFKIRTQLDIPVPEPVFNPFICEWKGCPAELHNLKTLEAHIFNVHNKKKPSGTRLCLWGKCGVKYEPVVDAIEFPKATDEPHEFKTKKEWKQHINEKHLIPFAWHMGDGPRGTSLSMEPDSDSSPWLKDKYGRQVTPSVKDQPIEEGSARANNARRFIRKVDGRFERIKSPDAYMKVQPPPQDSTSDGDDEDDTRVDNFS